MDRHFTLRMILTGFLFSSVRGLADDDKKEAKKEEWLCEKGERDIKADSKDACKKKGGKWKKVHEAHKSDAKKHD